MERIEGLSINLGLETSELSRGLTGLKDRLKTVNSEMRANLSAFSRADRSVEKYQATMTGLNRKMQLQTGIVEETKREYERLTAEFGENSKEAEKAAREYNHQVAALNNLQRQVERTSQELDDLQDEQREASTAWGKFRRSVDQTGDSLTGIGDRMQSTGGALTAGLTAPLAGLGILAGKTAMEFDSSQGRIQAQLGITAERAEELGRVAQNVWTQGFGENVEEVSNTVADLAQRMDDLTPDQLEEMTSAAFILAKTFDADVNLVTRSAASLMDQFGVSGSDAMDMITAAFQRGGNYSDELLETINEYSPQFKNLGFSASEMMGLFVSGAENSIWSLDKLADGAKESFLQITDGAKGTKSAIEELGLDYGQVTKDIQEGGDKASAAFGVIMTALAGVEEGADRNRLAIELMGTPIEDLGPQFVAFFAQTDHDLKDFEGSTKAAGEALQDNLGARAQKMWRDFLADMQPVGEELVDLAEDVLPKVASVIGKVTDAFNDLSPGAQKTALAVGGIAAAAGPTLTAVGFMSTGLGALFKTISPLLGTLGGGKGLLGILRKIPGPVGIVATGLGLAAGGFNIYKNAVEESKTVNLEHAETLLNQSQKLSDLTGKYDALRDKNKLSNDELLRFRDITSELELASSAEEIARLKDEQGKLQEKSGLTNDELGTMFGLNDDLIAQAPNIDQTFSDRGNAIIASRDATKEANAELREQIRLELENQRVKSEANLTQNIADYVTALQGLSQVEADRDAVRAERDGQRLLVKEREKELEDAIASGNAASVTIAENELLLAQGTLAGLETEVSKRSDIVAKKQESVGKSQEEIEKTQELYTKLIDLQLAQAGINTKGQEGIDQLDQAISKTQSRIGELKRAREQQGGLNEQQRQELGTLEETLGTQQTSRQEIGRIQGAQSGVNEKVKEGKRQAEGMTKELGRDVKKDVDVDDNGKAEKIHKKAGQDANKRVNITTWFKNLGQKAKDLLGFQHGTRNAPGGLSIVGEAGPELIYLPKGTRVIPNKDSEKIFRNWNIPMLQNGGTVRSSGAALVGEAGPELALFPGGNNSQTRVIGSLEELGNTFKNESNKTITILSEIKDNLKKTKNELPKATPLSVAKAPIDKGFSQTRTKNLTTLGGGAARSYFDAIRSDGDWANDWLTHIGPDLRDEILEQGYNLAVKLGHKQSATAQANYRRLRGFKTGGIVSEPGIYRLAEEGFSEFIIPTNPARRSEASKLLALAAKTIEPGARSTTAAAQPTITTAKSPQPVMIQLITPDKREFARWLIDDISELQKLSTSRISLFERR